MTTVGRHDHVGSQAIGEVCRCLVDVFLWQLFPDGLQGDFELLHALPKYQQKSQGLLFMFTLYNQPRVITMNFHVTSIVAVYLLTLPVPHVSSTFRQHAVVDYYFYSPFLRQMCDRNAYASRKLARYTTQTVYIVSSYAENAMSTITVTENKKLNCCKETVLLLRRSVLAKYNWKTIFCGHCRSIFNHCDVIDLQSYRIR